MSLCESESNSEDKDENEYKLYMIKSYDDLEISYNSQIIYFYNYIQMYECQLYKIQKGNKLYKYVMLKLSFQKLFNSFEIETYNGDLDEKSNKYSIIDESFFNNLYETKNKGLNSCITQLIIFKNNSNIIEKCKKMKKIYVISKVAIKMFDICTIMSDDNTDSSFIAKIRNLNILDMYLEFGSEQIKIYSDNRSISYLLRPILNYDNLDNHINEIYKIIKIMIGDLILDYSLSRSEPYFIERLYRIDNVNENFIKLLERENNNTHGIYKYCYNDMTKILGYDIHNLEHNKYLNSIINDLEKNIDYKITKNMESMFLISRIGFYKICKKSSKSKAKIFLEYFDYLYEQAIDYLKYTKLIHVIKDKDETINDLNKKYDKLKILYQKIKQNLKIISGLFLSDINILPYISIPILNFIRF
jgi:hypothetical protein